MSLRGVNMAHNPDYYTYYNHYITPQDVLQNTDFSIFIGRPLTVSHIGEVQTKSI